ncbi:MFS general substrate transporter [Aspergillus bertholletiae]|uniref:MFS general substrate transporter n=1 Tax=Aspergillus bertholletiae TaxID=1226010 RepID=A0A5N7BHG8_9EURO|nr:MFS general substrate transporter [Aspergillus bertholletiae]
MKSTKTSVENSVELNTIVSTPQGTAPEASVLSEKRKISTIITSSAIDILAFFTAGLYYPALIPLAQTLHVSKVNINLTITSYMLAQGLTPLVTGNLSDQYGRRPVLLICLLISVGVNVGLACQTNFAALAALRCVQSFGSSGVISVTGGIIVDVITRSERGKYLAYTSIGATIGTSLGPVLGGVLTQFLGWRSIFGFLAILASILLIVVIVFQPETCRVVVGNGSVPPQPWNRPLLPPHRPGDPDVETRATFSRRPKILDSVKLLLDKQMGQLILFISVVGWGSTAVIASIPMLMEEKYYLNTLKIGLCYLPFAAGGITARWTVGFLADWNFRRHSHQLGMKVERNRQSKAQLSRMPLEKVRLQIALPAIYYSSLFLLGYGWSLASNTHLSVPLIMLFFLGNGIAGVENTAGALIMDLQVYRAGMARAAVLLCRFIPGAGVIVAVPYLIQSIGIGWLGTIIAGLWVASSLMLWVVYFKGHKWRGQSNKA